MSKRLLWFATLVVVAALPARGQQVWSHNRGEGGIVVRDGVPAYTSKSSMDVKRTFDRGEAVVGVHKEFIAYTYEFFAENGRVQVAFPKEDSAVLEMAWMDPEDLLQFTYECCDEHCIPVKGSLKRAEWNACFNEGASAARARLSATERPQSVDASPAASRPAQGTGGPAERPLTNDDVIAMVKADLGDDLVIAKIQQAPSEALDVSTEALVRLKSSGVSRAVLDAMLRRASQR